MNQTQFDKQIDKAAALMKATFRDNQHSAKSLRFVIDVKSMGVFVETQVELSDYLPSKEN